MALKLFDGFDTYTNLGVTGYLAEGWNALLTPTSISALGSGVYGYGRAANIGAVGASGCLFAIPANVAWIHGYHFVAGSAFNDTLCAAWYDGGTPQASMSVDSTGHIKFWRGLQTTLLGTSANTILANSTHWVTYKAVFSQTVGTFRVDVDGVNFLNLSGLDNCASANAFAISSWIYRWGSAGTGQIDNVHICDDVGGAPFNDLLLERRVYFNMPNGPGALSEFTPVGAATIWEAVDENPSDGDTTYASSNVAGQRFYTTVPDLTGVGAVDALKISITGRKDDAGAGLVQASFREGGVNYDQGAIALTATYQRYKADLTTMPSGAALTVSGVNALEYGVKDD